MPIRNSLDNEAVRAKVKRDAKGRHPLIQKPGAPHTFLWNWLVKVGNKQGGASAAQMRAALPNVYHPQVLADLMKSALVAKVPGKKVGNSFFYVADENGTGIIPQQVEIEVELYETDTGAFVTRTYLRGRKEEPGKIVRYLGSRTMRMDVPGLFASQVQEVATDIEPDTDPDPAETTKFRRAGSGANVIIDVLADVIAGNDERGVIIDNALVQMASHRSPLFDQMKRVTGQTTDK